LFCIAGSLLAPGHAQEDDVAEALEIINRQISANPEMDASSSSAAAYWSWLENLIRPWPIWTRPTGSRP
jgi:hypothetical protein